MAAVKVLIPGPLRRLTGGCPELALEGDDVAGVLASLRGSCPGLARGLLDASGRPRRFVSLALNEVDIRKLDGVRTRVKEGDLLALIVALAGG